MSDKPSEFMARREEWTNGISLYLRQDNGNGGMSVAQLLTLETVENGMSINPFMQLKIQEAQQLMDELWQCGLRPSEGAGSAGSLLATEKHLEDMRLIVMNKLNIVTT